MKLRELKLRNFAICILFILSTPIETRAFVDVLDVLKVVSEVSTTVLKAWDIVQHTSIADHSINFPLMRDEQRKVLQRLKEVSRQIDATEEKHAHEVALAMDSINYFIARNTPLFARIKDIEDTINSISSRYEQMMRYEAHRNNLESSTLVAFAEWTVSPDTQSVQHLMDTLHKILFGAEEKVNKTNMLSLLAQNYE